MKGGGEWKGAKGRREIGNHLHSRVPLDLHGRPQYYVDYLHCMLKSSGLPTGATECCAAQ